MADLSVVQRLRLAQQHYAAGDFLQAQSLLQQLLAEDPGCAAALHGLGLIAHRKGEHRAAAELLAQTINLEPCNATALCNLGAVYESLDRSGDAISCFQRALSLKEDALTHYNLANVLQKCGR